MSVDPSVAGPQSAPAVVSESTPVTAPPILSEEQRVLLRCVLNRVVPASGVINGAGDLSVGSTIERTLAESLRLRRLFLDGLVQIAVTAAREAGGDFHVLDTEQQVSVLKKVELSSPAFFTALVEHTYRGYYTHAAVQAALGSRPPQPIGYELPAFDPAILERQRHRAPFWRHVD